MRRNLKYLYELSQRAGPEAGLEIAFSTGISLEEEINKSTNTDVRIMVLSYLAMFVCLVVRQWLRVSRRRQHIILSLRMSQNCLLDQASLPPPSPLIPEIPLVFSLVYLDLCLFLLDLSHTWFIYHPSCHPSRFFLYRPLLLPWRQSDSHHSRSYPLPCPGRRS